MLVPSIETMTKITSLAVVVDQRVVVPEVPDGKELCTEPSVDGAVGVDTAALAFSLKVSPAFVTMEALV